MAKATSKARKVKAKHQFGSGAYVCITNPESPYYQQKGTIVNNYINPEGEQLVAFDGEHAGSELIHANDLELVEDAQPVVAPPAEGPAPIVATPVEEVPVHLIVGDIQQPRQHYDEASMEELTESIKVHGVLQPIVLRKNPYLIHDEPYCIVFGERRWRAAKLAGLTTVPASIRVMTEMQALELQVIENLQRKDIHPMEEGRAFKKLHDAGSDIEALRHKIGVSAKYVATRIKLADLTQQWQEAYLNNRIDMVNAIKLSKLDAKTQGMLYRDATKNLNPTQSIGLWNLDETVRNSNHDLDKAPFKTEDATLNPEMGKCSTCPFNTSNTPRLFMGEERICTNSACYSIKEKNNYKKKLTKAASEPDIVFLDNTYYKGTEEKKKIAAAKEMGVTIVSRDEVITAPEDPGPKPEWEAYKAERLKEYQDMFEDGDEPFDEEDCKLDFESELETWEENQKDFEQSKRPESMRRAFVVVGDKAGKYVDILIRAENPDVSVNGDNPIAEIEKREARAKELDHEKVYKQVVPLIKEHEGFMESASPLSTVETGALVIYLLDSCSYSCSGWFQREMGLTSGRAVSTEMYQKAISEMLPGTLNKLIRRVIMDRLINATEIDYGQHGKAAAIMDIARQYLPAETKELELQQEEKAIKRQKNVEKRIEDLKASTVKETSNA